MSKIPNTFNDYDEFVDETATWLRLRASAYHWYYYATRVSLVIIGIALAPISKNMIPFLPSESVPYLAFVIAILGALEALFQPSEKWHHFRSNQLAIQRIQRISRSRRMQLSVISDSDERTKAEMRELKIYVEQIETQLETEIGRFFEKALSEHQPNERDT